MRIQYLDRAAEEAARSYAERTGGAFDGAWSSASRDGQLVLFATFGAIDPAVLEAVYGCTDRPAARLVLGRTGASLRRQAILQSDRARAHRRGSGHLILSPLQQECKVVDSNDETHVIPFRESEIRNALAGRKASIILTSHSDGIDALLHPGLTLCTALTRSGRSLACAATDRCHRQQLSVTEARRQNRLLSPTDLATDLLVLNVCHGLRFPLTAKDRGFELAELALSNPDLTSVVTTWNAIVPVAHAGWRVHDALRAGASVEEVVAALNAAEVAAGAQPSYCLLGAPAIIAEGRRSPIGLGRAAAPIPARPAQDGAAAPRPDFLIHWLLVAALEVPDHAEREFTTAAERVRRQWILGSLGYSEPPGGAPADVAEALFAYLSVRGRQIRGDWLKMAEREYAIGRIPCPSCGWTATIRSFSLRTLARSRRSLITCPRCSVVSDIPASRGFRLKIQNGKIGAFSNIFRSGQACVWLSRWEKAQAGPWPWPREASGRLSNHFILPAGIENWDKVEIAWTDGSDIAIHAVRVPCQDNSRPSRGNAARD